MRITTLWVRYPGDSMSTLLDAADEWLDDDNPDYMAGKITEARTMLARGDIADYAVADIEVDSAWVDGLFARQSTVARPGVRSGGS